MKSKYILARTNLSCNLILLGLIFMLGFCQSVNAQPVLKKVFTFNSGNSPSCDWIYSIISSSDCIHYYFAGYSEAKDQSGNVIRRYPVMGKINSKTNTLVWEHNYSVDGYTGNGTFNSIIEEGTSIIAVGEQAESSEINRKAIVNMVESETGNPLIYSGSTSYPIALYASDFNSRLNEVKSLKDGSGNLTGFMGIGTKNPRVDDKLMFVKLLPNGDPDPSFGTNGSFTFITGPIYDLPEDVGSRGLNGIKVEGNYSVEYVIVGNIFECVGTNCPSNALIIGLNSTGNVLWHKILGESTNEPYVLDDYNYVDINSGQEISLCKNSNYEGTDQLARDIVQDESFLVVSAEFDRLVANSPNDCMGNLTFDDTYRMVDGVIFKFEMDGDIVLSKNVGMFEGDAFYCDLEVKDGEYYILGSDAQKVNGTLNSKTRLIKTDNNLLTLWDKTIPKPSNAEWETDCGFDMAFDCNGEIIIGGDANVNAEDYFLQVLSNECQSNVTFNGNDVLDKLEISSPLTWSSSKKVKATIYVKSGGELTINSGAIIEFGSSWDLVDYTTLANSDPDGKAPRIIVELGGELILDNCTLRGLSACTNNSMWDGIEVRDGGLITMANSPTIQDAKIGILVDVGMYDADGQLNPTQSNGCGQVNAMTGSIIDCRFGIHFAPCNANSSVINGINFSCSGGLKDPSYKALYSGNPSIPDGLYQLGTKTFISSNNVEGISITGGSISGGYFPPALRGIGIASWNSRVNLNGGVNINNVFIGLQADANDATRFFTITGGNSFNANFRGIIFRGGGMHKVMDENEFTVRYPLYPNPTLFGSGIGIYNAGSILTRIEDNDFTAGQGNNTGTIGIVNENSGSGASLIKKNRFNNIDIGDQTQKDNGGLNLWCNDYINNRKAWSINPQTLGAFRDQGECTQFKALTSENEFQDPPCQLPLNHIRSTQGFTYWTKQSEQFVPGCNSTIVSTQGCFELDLKSGCTETILLTPGNVNYYFTLVPTLPNGEERQLLVNDLIRYYIGVGNSENIHTLLQNESNENYKMTYAMLLLNEGNITGAQAVVASLPISSSETSSFTTYFNVLLYAVQNNISLGALPENKVRILETLVEDRTLAAYASQAILITYYGKEYLLPIETESGIEYRSRGNDNSDDMNQMIRIQPNPVSDILSLKINILQESKLELEIRSINGNLISTTSMNGKNFEIKLDVSQFNSGVYLLRLKDQRKEIYLNKFIKL